MPDPDLIPNLQALIECHPEPDHAERRIWQAWEAGDLGSADCRRLLAKVRGRRQALAEERRRTVDDPDFG